MPRSKHVKPKEQYIGSGTYGKVVKIDHQGVTCAKKTSDRPQYVELDILKGLNHPNLVRLLDVAVELDSSRKRQYSLYFPLYQHVTAPVDDKEESIQWRSKYIPLLIHHVLSALMALRYRGWYHRDVKPENIMFDSDNDRFILIDVGLALKDSATYTHTHFTCSSAYRPPRMISYPGKYPPELPYDVFALGVSVCCFLEREKETVDSETDDDKLKELCNFSGIPESVMELVFDMLSFNLELEDAYTRICEILNVGEEVFDEPDEFTFSVKSEVAKKFVRTVARVMDRMNSASEGLTYALMTGLKYLELNPDFKDIGLVASASAFIGYEYCFSDPQYPANLFRVLSQDEKYSENAIRKQAETMLVGQTGGVSTKYQMSELLESLGSDCFDPVSDELWDTVKEEHSENHS